MSKNHAVTAIIQARMGSSRLPGKVLMDICGKPMVWHVVKRLKESSLIDTVVVATSKNREDDILIRFLEKERILFYRGSEEDVLDRYYQAAFHFHAKIIVRITADCPLIDPKISDKVIAKYLSNCKSYDGASNTIRRSFPRGLDTEVFPFTVLEKIWLRARKVIQREHVTPYLYTHQKAFKMLNVESSVDYSALRWTVDEAADLQFVRMVYENLYVDGEIFYMNGILRLLKQKPYLAMINNKIKQKKVL